MNEQNSTGRSPVAQRALELLNRGIDGELNRKERDELDHLLATSAAVRDLDEELRTVTRLLDELPDVEPPHYLQESIERQVRLPQQGNAGQVNTGRLAGWLSTNWLRTGFALAAGVILTVGVYEMGSKPISPTDDTALSGTIVKRTDTNQQGVLLDRVSLKSDRMTGQVELRNTGELLTLGVQLTSDTASELVVKFAGRGLEFDGVTRLQDQVGNVSVADGAIHLASQGEQRYTVSFKRISGAQHDMPLLLEFFADNELVQQTELNISKF